MKDESDRRLDRTIRWSGILISVIVVIFCGKPFVNHFMYQRECTALLADARKLEGLSREEALQRLKRAQLVDNYICHAGVDSIILISRNQYDFLLSNSIPAAELTTVHGKASQAKLIVRGSYF